MIKGSVLNSCQNVLLSTRSSSNSSTMIEKSVQDVLKVLVLNKISALSSYSIIIIIIIKICLKILSKLLAFFCNGDVGGTILNCSHNHKISFFGDIFPISLSNHVSPFQSNSLKMLVANLLTKPVQISPLPP